MSELKNSNNKKMKNVLGIEVLKPLDKMTKKEIKEVLKDSELTEYIKNIAREILQKGGDIKNGS